jgi:hypothetical protein
MRRFFLALRVRVQVVARSFPDVVQPVQRPAKSVLGDPLFRGDLQGLLEQRHCPVHVRVAEVLGGDGEEGLQQVLVVFVQQRMTSPAFLVLKGRGIVVLGVSLDPVVDTLPSYPEHACDIGGAAAMVEFQDGEGPLEDTGIPGLCELTPETSSLPGGQIEPAHGFLLHRSSCS